MATAAPATAPATTQQTSTQPAPVNPHGDDMGEWIGRVNQTIKDPSHITNPPAGTQEWAAGFFDCFNPIDTCLMTYCCPCVTFGKTHHRLRKGDLQTWQPINASCLTWMVAAWVGCHCIPTLMQNSEIRHRADPKLTGDFATDCLKAWCCHCCTLIQQDKEAEALIAKEVVMQQPVAATKETMSYPA